MITAYSWLTLALAATAVLVAPALAILIRGAVKWTRTESKLDQLITHTDEKLGALVGDIRELVDDKDRAHHEMLEQMRLDRDATDRRLRYLEEFWIDKGRQGFGRRG